MLSFYENMNDESAESKRAFPFLSNMDTTSDVTTLINLVPVPGHFFGPKSHLQWRKKHFSPSFL